MPRIFDNIDQSLLPPFGKHSHYRIEPTFAWGTLIFAVGRPLMSLLKNGQEGRTNVAACSLGCNGSPRKTSIRPSVF